MLRLASCATLLGGWTCAHAQPVAPSQVTPPSVRPQPPVSEPGERLAPAPDPAPQVTDADQAEVELRRVDVEGGRPELAQGTSAWARTLEGRRITLGEIRRQIALLEDTYHRSGYFLVRVTLPPQRLRDGGTLRVVVLDGFIEQVDIAGVPERLRAAVERTLRPLVGVRGLMLHEAERRIRVAGNLAGLRLRSALSTGEQPGGTRLLLQGELRSIGLGVTLDNGLARSLGTAQALFSASLNSALGHGERFYAALGTGRHIDGWTRGEAPLALAAVGLVAPIGIEGATLNPELTQTVLNPEPVPNGLRMRGRLSRAALRLSTPLAEGHHAAVDGQLALERVAQRQEAPDFAAVVSNDRYTALRVGLDATLAIEPTSTSITAFTQWSIGLGGRTPDPESASEPTLSRQGASPRFQRLGASMRVTQPIGRRSSLALIASGQSSFGEPLMLSEQFALSGSDKVSGYTPGSLAVDDGVALRAELSWPLPMREGPHRVMAAPYTFAATGRGRLRQPTAVEQPRIRARSAGFGVRAAYLGAAGAQSQLNLELAHPSDPPPDDDGQWQLSLRFSHFW